MSRPHHSNQLSFLEDAPKPSGFEYLPSFITAAEEDDLLRHIRSLKLSPYEMRGVESKRLILEFKTVPSWLTDLKQRAEELLKAPVVEALVTHYPVGSQIGWHVDIPEYESLVGISLKGSCKWKMKRGEETYDHWLEPRSAYVVQGDARWLWQHHIPAVKEERYSLTFRTSSGLRVRSTPDSLGA